MLRPAVEHSPTGKGKLMHAVIRKFPNMQNVKEAALAAYPGARADLMDDGIRLHPSPSPTGSILRLAR